MSDLGGERPDGTDRSRWGGFPGAEPGPEQYPAQDPPAGGLGPADPPTAPQFPVVPPPDDLTAPIPLVGATYEPPPPSRPRGSHRAAPVAATRDGQAWMRYLTIGGLAAVLVVAALYGFAACTSTDDVQVPVAPVVASTSPAASPSPSGSPSTSSSASASASPSTSASSSATGSPRASSSASPRATGAKPSKTAKPAAKAVKQPVVVLNSTGVVGLAKRVADDIRAEGWTVPETANWRGGSVPVTTIYYLPGAKNKASAQLFKKTFDVATVVRPALPGMTSPLVLVLAGDAA
jgi:hypothetical protein